MNYKQAIYKEREVDLKATVEQLDLHEAVMVPFSNNLKVSAIRTAISRLNGKGDYRYSVTECINHTIITRTV